MQLASYAWVEGQSEEVQKQIDKPKENLNASKIVDKAAAVTDKMDWAVNHLPNPDRLWESIKDSITPLTAEQVRSHVKMSDSEKELARMYLVNKGEEATDANITDHIVSTRAERNTSNTFEYDGEKITEPEFVNRIAEESGVEAELLQDLRAIWFEGSHEWPEDEIAERYTQMVEDIKNLVWDGEELPKTKEEFLALWEHLNVNDTGESSNTEMTAAEVKNSDLPLDEKWNLDANAEGYRQVWDMVIWQAWWAYSVGWQIYRWSGEVSREVNTNLDTSYNWLQQNPWEPMPAEYAAKLKNKENKAIIEKMIPVQWHGAAVELANKEWELNPSYPIMISSMTEKRWLVAYPDGKVDDFPIIIWSGGYREGAHRGGNTTPTYEVFHMNMNTKVTDVWVDASNSGSKTVLWCSIQSPEWAASGGKWWHWVADSRIPGGATAGCIGWNQQSMMMAGRAVLSAWGGYGFNVKAKTG